MEASRSLRAPTQRPLRQQVALALAALLVTAGCGNASAERTVAGAPVEPTGPVVIGLVQTEDGLAGVPVDTSTPRWVLDGAVAAPDGSAAFVARQIANAAGGYEVVRVDAATGVAAAAGTVVNAATVPVEVAAVAPDGARVAAVEHRGDATVVHDIDTLRGVVQRSVTFEGRLEPEAYSVDGNIVFAARIFDGFYHVHALDLRTGEQWPTLGRDKSKPAEDMYGNVVQAVLSPDRTQLATLYRDNASAGHTAFVHLLSLVNGTTVCIDLHEPFGTGERGTDAIAWLADGTVAAGHRAAADPLAATFDPAAIWEGEILEHYHAEVTADPDAPTVPAGLAAVPGFVRYVAIAGQEP